MTKIIDTTTTEVARTLFQVQPQPTSGVRFDDFRLIDGATFSTYAMTPNNANELTQMTSSTQGTTIDYTYDAWGRTTEKAIGAHSALYAWRYDSKMYSVDSDIPGEGDVTYGYGGDGKRRSRTAGGVTTGYNWAGWSVINEENSGGTLTCSYIGNRAHVDGSNPGSGNYTYYQHDHLGSTRALYNQSKTLLASQQYTPYGEHYAGNAAGLTPKLYTGHAWDVNAQQYFAPYRYYSAAVSRWSARDPLGMVDGPNTYSYVGNKAIKYVDRLGLNLTLGDCARGFEICVESGINSRKCADCMMKCTAQHVWPPGCGPGPEPEPTPEPEPDPDGFDPGPFGWEYYGPFIEGILRIPFVIILDPCIFGGLCPPEPEVCHLHKFHRIRVA